jgi:hypothetical protein
MHYLNRRQDLHGPALYRLFWSSVVDARTIRTDWTERGYFGFDRHTQGHYLNPFHFVYFSDPLFGYAQTRQPGGVACADGAAQWEEEMRNVRSAISAVNKLRPRYAAYLSLASFIAVISHAHTTLMVSRFVVIGGNFVSSLRDSSSEATGCVDDHTMQTDAVRRCFARISETIPVLFVPGDIDVGGVPTPDTIGKFEALCLDNTKTIHLFLCGVGYIYVVVISSLSFVVWSRLLWVLVWWNPSAGDQLHCHVAPRGTPDTCQSTLIPCLVITFMRHYVLIVVRAANWIH